MKYWEQKIGKYIIIWWWSERCLVKIYEKRCDLYLATIMYGKEKGTKVNFSYYDYVGHKYYDENELTLALAIL